MSGTATLDGSGPPLANQQPTIYDCLMYYFLTLEELCYSFGLLRPQKLCGVSEAIVTLWRLKPFPKRRGVLSQDIVFGAPYLLSTFLIPCQRVEKNVSILP